MTVRLGLVVAALGGGVGCDTNPKLALKRAEELAAEGRHGESARVYRSMLKRLSEGAELSPEDTLLRAEALNALADINALHLRDYGEAVQDYAAVARHHPDPRFVRRGLMLAADIQQHKLGRLDQAIESLEELCKRYPESEDSRRARLKIAQIYFGLRNYDQAGAEAQKVILGWPQSPEALQAELEVAHSHYMLGQYDQAIAVYKRVLDGQRDPPLNDETHAVLSFELGDCYQAQGHPSLALNHYNESLAHHPNPELVQRKIERIRTRQRQSSPSRTVIESPR